MDTTKRRRVDHSGKAVAVPSSGGGGVAATEGDVPIGAVAENRLYVGNLERRVTEYHVLKVFKKFGEVKDLEMGFHRDGPRKGEMKGACFVEYHNRADAEAAKAGTHGRKLLGRPIIVRFVEERVVSNAGKASADGGGGGGGRGRGGADGRGRAAIPSDREYDPDGRRAAAAAAAARAQAESGKTSDEQMEAMYTAKIKQIRKRLAELKRRTIE